MNPFALNNRPALVTLIGMLILFSLIPLGVIAFHLSEFYLLVDQELPYPFVISLALDLIAIAILSGFVTTTIGKAIGPWTTSMTTASAVLVWAGNAYVMHLTVPAHPWYVPLLVSCFAPMFTVGLGAVLGILFTRLDRMTREQPVAESSVIQLITRGPRSGLDS